MTYSYADLLSMIRRSLANGIEEAFSAVICNLATGMIWNEFPWEEATATLPPFFLVPLAQDYGTPFAAVPTNFNGLRIAYLVQLNGNSVPQKKPLQIIADIRATHMIDFPSAISYEPSKHSFRLSHRTPKNAGAPEWLIEGTYAKKATKITNATLNTVLPVGDDQDILTWIEVAKWAGWMLGNDQRAGSIVVQGNQKVYSGQAANAITAIRDMAKQAGLVQGDPEVFPQNPLWNNAELL